MSCSEAVGTTQSELCQHSRAMVDRIDTSGAAFNAHIPRFLSETCPESVFYHNSISGECRDLIFGTSIIDYATARDLSEGDIPKIIRLCIEDIDRRGLEAEGIYWVSVFILQFIFYARSYPILITGARGTGSYTEGMSLRSWCMPCC